MKTIILSESDIQSLINGREVIKKDRDGDVLIRQSYVKDLVTPIINDRFQVSDVQLENSLKDIRLDALSIGLFKGAAR